MQAKQIAKIAIFFTIFLTVFNHKAVANNFYLGGGFGAENSSYSKLTPTKTAGFAKGFLGYQFSYLSVELGYSYGLEKDISTREQYQAYKNDSIYAEIAPKYSINENHSLLFLASIANVKQQLQTTQGIANESADKGDLIETTTNTVKQNDTVYGLGLGYGYSLNENIGLLFKYKYNMPANLSNYNSLEFNVRFDIL